MQSLIKMTMMTTNTRFRFGVLAFALVMMPGLASATPMEYEIGHGKLRLDVAYGGHGYSIALPVHSGRFTYDAATNQLSDLSVVAYHHRFSFRGPIDSDATTTLWKKQGRHVALRVGGIDLPRKGMPAVFRRFGSSISLKVAAIRMGHGGTDIYPVPTSPMPEPTAAFLFAAGLFAVGTAIRPVR